MSAATVQFEFEKETKNSVRYKEIPEEGKAPIVGSIYVQKWFAGKTKTITVTIDKNDQNFEYFIVPRAAQERRTKNGRALRR